MKKINRTLKLKQITVQSFSTLLESEKMNTVKGRGSLPIGSECYCPIPTEEVFTE